MDLFLRCPAYDANAGYRGVASKAGKLLQGLLGFDRQTAQLPNHEINNVIGVTLGVNAIQVPRPSPFAMIEDEQRLLGERRNKLNGKKWIAGGLLVNQLRQRGGALRFAVKRIPNQLFQVFTP